MELCVENLDYVYNQGTPIENHALFGISFSLQRGEILGILGESGSGKTTLIRTLAGFLQPTRGRVLLDGINMSGKRATGARKLGVVFQRPERQLFEETVLRDISFVLRRFSKLTEEEIRDKTGEVCKVLGLDLDLLGNRSPWELSGGEKRKAAIAGVLVNDPEVIILDEPAVGLDPPSVFDLVNALERMKKSHGETMVIVSHCMEPFLRLLDRLLVLDHGRMAAMGRPGEVVAALAGDGRYRGLLPDLCLFVHELRKAGLPVKGDEFRVSTLVEQIGQLLRPQGGSG